MNLIKSLAPLVFLAVLTFPAPVTAAVLLTIDASNTSAVTFTATGGAASASASKRFLDGIDLEQFFKSSPSTGLFNISGTLTTTSGGTPTYTRMAVDTLSGSNTALNIYVNSGNPQSTVTQFFNSGLTPFSGSVTVNMSSIASSLPSPGSQGTLYAGYSGSSPIAIGSWSTPAVVPEPSEWGMYALLGGMALALGRRLKLSVARSGE